MVVVVGTGASVVVVVGTGASVVVVVVSAAAGLSGSADRATVVVGNTTGVEVVEVMEVVEGVKVVVVVGSRRSVGVDAWVGGEAVGSVVGAWGSESTSIREPAGNTCRSTKPTAVFAT